VSAADNLLTVERPDGKRLTYDPRRLQGVSVYGEEKRSFAPGDRIQFTAAYSDQGITNRQLGTLLAIDCAENMRVHLDAGRDVRFSAQAMPHLDYGFASTSYAAQGTTVNRVILHVDSDMSREELVNSRLAYVGLSRAVSSMQVYTDDASRLVRNLARDVSKYQALPPQEEQQAARM
jgi:ATP-dependent exoDNAse (exonuclease V) alpha subunit